jgi:hypothetical protein
MRKRPELYVIREPEAPAASNVIPIGASVGSLSPRERSWRDLVRRLQKSPAPRTPGNSEHR